MQRLIKTPFFSLWPLDSREEQRSRRCPLPFCLDCYKNNFLAVSHLTSLQMTAMAMMYFSNMLVAPAKESWDLAGSPTLRARPHSQLLSLNYITLAERAQVSLYHTHKLDFAALGEGWNYFLAQDMCDMFPSTAAPTLPPAPTHTLTHTPVLFPSCHIPLLEWSISPFWDSPQHLSWSLYSSAFYTYSSGPSSSAIHLS